MRLWTNREYETRLEWIRQQWNKPSRTDNYLMQLASEIRASWTHKFLDTGKFRIKFDQVESGESERKGPVARTIQEVTAWAKARWFGMLGIKKPE